MDMFMDKLAQKLTAQEIIKANTTAEAEELNRLRAQIDEYDQCLARLRQLVEESEGKLQGMGGELSERMEEADRKMGERLGNVNRIIGDRLDVMDKSVTDQLNDVNELMENQLTASDNLREAIKNLEKALDEKLAGFEEKIGQETESQELLQSVSDTVHKECVKVYRNVQAVVLEESGKQTENAENVSSAVKLVRKKLNKVFGISIVALLLSLSGVAIQILLLLNNFLNIKLF